jgi:hypothetical protein
MTYGQPSGTTSFVPFLSDFAIDAMGRCGVFDIMSKHMFSVRRSMNYRLQHWGTLGVNLWTVDQIPTAITMIPGQAVYDLPADVITVLDTYRRTPGSITAASTVASSNVVTLDWIANGFSAGTTVSFIVPFSVGGLTIGGNYTVQSVPTADQFTIQALLPATTTAAIIINAPAQNAVADIFMTPQSRTDYASQANKAAQGPPSIYWFQKTTTPKLIVWPTPDSAQPYQIQTYLQHQVQDADPAGGQTASLPQRFWFAFLSDLAADLSITYAPERYEMLSGIAAKAFREASDDDVERASSYFCPNFSGYG